MRCSQTEFHRALGALCNPSEPEQGGRGAEKVLSLLPSEPSTPFSCLRDQSLLREKLSGLKQLEHPWESGSKTVLETAGQGQAGVLVC